MAHTCGLKQQEYEIHTLTNIEDVERAYRECFALLRELVRRGFAPEDIEVDYTSGTKAMTAGLVLAAVAQRCATLTYITGERSAGVVKDQTERLVSVEPRRVWADERIRLAMEFCRELNFAAAKRLLESLVDAWLGDYERQLRAGVLLLVSAYGAWDRFDYARAFGELRKLGQSKLEELQDFRPSPELPHRLLELKPTADQGSLTAHLAPDRLADLFNNAQRRLEEGRYDDALARLYRFAEMLAQSALAKDHGINTANVDVSRAPEPMGAKLEAHRTPQGLVQIGLELDYELLKALGHNLGVAFNRREFHGLGVLLQKRNHSLLAHGFTPIAKEDVESLMQRLKELAKLEIADFDGRCAALEFPWRKGRNRLPT
jgi:CRISPR-associated protein (TIGR02710 family)